VRPAQQVRRGQAGYPGAIALGGALVVVKRHRLSCPMFV
jgi:hypothetical protein